MTEGPIDDKASLVQVMAWCHQAPSHYLEQCWQNSTIPYGITRPEWLINIVEWVSKLHMYQLIFKYWVPLVKDQFPHDSFSQWSVVYSSIIHAVHESDWPGFYTHWDMPEFPIEQYRYMGDQVKHSTFSHYGCIQPWSNELSSRGNALSPWGINHHPKAMNYNPRAMDYLSPLLLAWWIGTCSLFPYEEHVNVIVH